MTHGASASAPIDDLEVLPAAADDGGEDADAETDRDGDFNDLENDYVDWGHLQDILRAVV